MKRWLIILATTFLGTTTILSQSGYCGPNLRWSFNSSNGMLTITGNGRMNDFHYDYSCQCHTIPWDNYRKSITQVDLPDGITTIGNEAFYGCIYLSSITIPESVSSIGKSAFDGCKYLQAVTIPCNVISIGNNAFQSCERLKTVTFCNRNTKVGSYAFFDCKNLQSINDKQGIAILDVASAITFPTNSLKSASNPSSVSASSTTISLSKITTSPPNLVIVDNSLEFIDNTKNNQIDANEFCKIHFKVQNIGKGNANGCVATIKMNGNTSGITAKDVSLKMISAGETLDVYMPVSSNIQTATGDVTFTIEVKEPKGFGTDPFELSVSTRAYEQPYLQIVDYAITGNSGGTLVKKQPFNLQLMLQNTKYGLAENIEVELQLPNNVFLLDGEEITSLTKLDGGKAKSIDYQLVVNNNYNSTNIPIQVSIREKYGKFAKNKTINLQLNQDLSSTRLTVKAVEEELRRQEIKLATIGSDVDKNIPQTTIKNPNTFVLIIANENYQSVASVPFALNDGRIFRQYCEQTLGIPAKNIHEIANATGNQLKAQINWLQNVVEVFDNPQVIFYYAGHGIPDESSKTAYLLPVDGSGTDVTTGYKLDDLYATLGNMPASRITVFMDACFSGSRREEGMLAEARGVALKAKSGVPQGNMVVFSAAQGDETAYPNREKQHGLFTYYLLKKLQETEGDVSLKELGDYVTKQVSQQSLLLNSKKQTPCVTPSSAVANEWQNWKLK